MGNELVVIKEVKSLINSDETKKRMNDVLGKKAGQFSASVVSAVTSASGLQKCNPGSIMAAAFVAAALDLPIDQNLGFAAIVPYGNKAQFQIMYKGFIQLAIRTGQYRGMNSSEVYEDELKQYNPITKEVSFTAVLKDTTQRMQGETDKIVGYYAWFELLNGFKQSNYMTIEEITLHAKEYSKSYQYDLRDNKKSSRWSTDFGVMALKTVTKLLLSKWGILSIEIQQALSEDQKTFEEDDNSSYEDNPKEIVLEKAANPFEDKKDGLTELQQKVKDASSMVDLKKIAKELKLQKSIVDLVEIQAWDKLGNETCIALVNKASNEMDKAAS